MMKELNWKDALKRRITQVVHLEEPYKQPEEAAGAAALSVEIPPDRDDAIEAEDDSLLEDMSPIAEDDSPITKSSKARFFEKFPNRISLKPPVRSNANAFQVKATKKVHFADNCKN